MAPAGLGRSAVRLCVYSDYPYQRLPEGISASLSFALFINEVANRLGGVVLMGRLDPSASAMRHPVAPHSRFVALPLLRVAHPTVGRLSGTGRVAPTVLANAGRGRLHLALWTAPVRDRVCRDRGAPQAVSLGVRQNWPNVHTQRHPRRPDLWVAAGPMEAAFRALAFLCPVVAVGPELARRYRHARPLLEVAVSLVSEDDIVPPRMR